MTDFAAGLSEHPVTAHAVGECIGQVLESLGEGAPPRFVRRYANVGEEIAGAARRFIEDVRTGAFPSDSEIYSTPAPVESRKTGGS